MVKTGITNGKFYMITPYNPIFVAEVKGIYGARFGDIDTDGITIRKVWTVPVDSQADAEKILEKNFPGDFMAMKATKIQKVAMTPDEAYKLLMESDEAVEQALLMVYSGQTGEEQIMEGTLDQNSIGFNKPDSGYGSFLARQVIGKIALTPGQLEAARRMLAKYKRQLVGLTALSLSQSDQDKAKELNAQAKPIEEKNSYIVAYTGNRTTPTVTKQGPFTPTEANAKWSSYKQPDSGVFKLEAIKNDVKVTEWIRPARFTANLSNDKLIALKSNYEDKDLVKGFRGATWDAQDKVWKLPLNQESVNTLMQYESNIAPEVIESIEGKKNVIRNLREIAKQDDSKISHPAGSKLRDFQRTGVKFLTTAKRAILGDDMGLGKSLQAMVAAEELGSENVLIIVPNSLKRNWYKEYLKWNIRPENEVTLISGDKDKREDEIKNFKKGVMIINYDHLRPDRPNHIDELLKKKWDTVIVDEAHKIKHRESQQTQGVQQICHKADKACYLLTGTPPGEVHFIWNLLHAIKPEEYPSYWKFVRDNTEVWKERVSFDKEVTKISGIPKNAKQFREDILDPAMIRRLKTDKLPDLPEKQYREVWVDMEPSQAKIYKQMVDTMAAEVENGKEVTTAVLLAQLNRLRQIAVSPDIMMPDIGDIDNALKRSNKIKAMMDIIEGTSGKVVIFSQYERAVSLACQAFDKASPPIKYVRYTGKEGEKARNEAVEKFMNDPSVKVMIMTTAAGGLGLTLTVAHDAIFLDKMWNPEDNVQAEDRIHRIGQTADHVTIHEILSENTLDEWVENILNTKTAIDASVMDIINKYHDSRKVAQTLKSIAYGKTNSGPEFTMDTVKKMKVGRPKTSVKTQIYNSPHEGITTNQ